jgi:hypothetical protein
MQRALPHAAPPAPAAGGDGLGGRSGKGGDLGSPKQEVGGGEGTLGPLPSREAPKAVPEERNGGRWG